MCNNKIARLIEQLSLECTVKVTDFGINGCFERVKKRQKKLAKDQTLN